MNLKEAIEGQDYIIREIRTDDEELNAFLFSLGCYSGETITVISHLRSGCIVSINHKIVLIDHETGPICNTEQMLAT